MNTNRERLLKLAEMEDGRSISVGGLFMAYDNERGIKLFLDDLRPAPPGFVLLRETELAMFFYLAKHADVISMDHDLGENIEFSDTKDIDGYKVLCMLEEEAIKGHIWSLGVPEIVVHSANPPGRQKMEACVQRLYSKLGKKQKTD